MMTVEEKRELALDRIKESKDPNEIKAWTEFYEATFKEEELKLKQQSLDIDELRLRSEEERSEKEIKSANKRSLRQLSGDNVRTFGSIAVALIYVAGTWGAQCLGYKAESDPDNPFITRLAKIAKIIKYN